MSATTEAPVLALKDAGWDVVLDEMAPAISSVEEVDATLASAMGYIDGLHVAIAREVAERDKFRSTAATTRCRDAAEEFGQKAIDADARADTFRVELNLTHLLCDRLLDRRLALTAA